MDMYTECRKCGVKFNWTVKENEDPSCERCKDLHSSDPRLILKLLSEHRVPGQIDIIRAMSLMLDRIESLEAKKLAKN